MGRLLGFLILAFSLFNIIIYPKILREFLRMIKKPFLIRAALFLFLGIAFAREKEEILLPMEKALEAYESNVGTYPTIEQGLGALIRRPVTVDPGLWKGPYLSSMPLDPWGEEYIYQFPGTHQKDYDLSSKGPDRMPNTADDIVNWGKTKKIDTRVGEIPTTTTLFPELDPSKNYTETAGGLNYEMIWIGPGEFLYGSHLGAYGIPTVRMDGYWIGKYEITARQYCIFLNAVENPEEMNYILVYTGSTYTIKEGRFVPRAGCENKPAYPVSWLGAAAFCGMLGEGTGRKYYLPTEAEWERAARGGIKLKLFPWGDEPADGRANFGKKKGEEREILTPVGSFPPNPYGLYDMAGNAMEWCDDWYEKTVELKVFTNPSGPSSGIDKLMRGGNVFSIEHYLRLNQRYHNPPWFKSAGFRIVREP